MGAGTHIESGRFVQRQTEPEINRDRAPEFEVVSGEEDRGRSASRVRDLNVEFRYEWTRLML